MALHSWKTHDAVPLIVLSLCEADLSLYRCGTVNYILFYSACAVFALCLLSQCLFYLAPFGYFGIIMGPFIALKEIFGELKSSSGDFLLRSLVLFWSPAVHTLKC